jgi:hypothetical protein
MDTNTAPRFIDFADLEAWFERARRPSGPVMEAERHFADLVWSGDTEPPRLSAYDDLAIAASRGRRWIEVNPCPDETIGLHFIGQLLAYSDVVRTIRSAIAARDEGAVMVGRLTALRDEIDLHAEMIDILEP